MTYSLNSFSFWSPDPLPELCPDPGRWGLNSVPKPAVFDSHRQFLDSRIYPRMDNWILGRPIKILAFYRTVCQKLGTASSHPREMKLGTSTPKTSGEVVKALGSADQVRG